MQVYFIRHAQSTNNALWDRTGGPKGRVEDPELTDIGKEQLVVLAKYFQTVHPENPNGRKDYQNRYGFGLTHLYASPMVRALQTGLAVSEVLGLPLTLWKDIHEGGGIFLEDENGAHHGLPGKPRSFFEKNYPKVKLTPEIKEDGWWNAPFEPYEIRQNRAQRVLNTLLENHKDDDRVALFSHGGFFNYFISCFLKCGADEFRWIDINNVSISRFDIDLQTKFKRILYVNKTDHLPSELIT